MAIGRSGAPTWIVLITKCCKLSRNIHWRAAAIQLIGTDASDIIAAWDTFCALFEIFLAGDDFPGEIDHTEPFGATDVEEV